MPRRRDGAPAGDPAQASADHPEWNHNNAGWFTAAVRCDPWIATADLHLRILEVSPREPLRESGKLIRAGKTLAGTEMEVRGISGRLIATGTAWFVVTSVAFEIA